MKAYWEKYAGLYDARLARERIIIALSVLALMYFVWDFSFGAKLSAKRELLQSRYSKANLEIQRLSEEERILSQALMNNPNSKKQRELMLLADRVEALDGEISELSTGLIPASKLPSILRAVLMSRKDLSLLGLHALAPEKQSLKREEDHSNLESEEVEPVGVFKHTVVLRLKGSYFSVREYLRELEVSEWNFYWSSLDYVVDAYPKAVVQVEVYTLSTDKGFIGEKH